MHGWSHFPTPALSFLHLQINCFASVLQCKHAPSQQEWEVAARRQVTVYVTLKCPDSWFGEELTRACIPRTLEYDGSLDLGLWQALRRFHRLQTRDYLSSTIARGMGPEVPWATAHQCNAALDSIRGFWKVQLTAPGTNLHSIQISHSNCLSNLRVVQMSRTRHCAVVAALGVILRCSRTIICALYLCAPIQTSCAKWLLNWFLLFGLPAWRKVQAMASAFVRWPQTTIQFPFEHFSPLVAYSLMFDALVIAL